MNLLDLLNIKTTQQNNKKVILTMQIQPEHLQPYGQMHGGISAVLIETAASIGANLNLEKGRHAVGSNINVNHLRPMGLGKVSCCAEPVKIGKTLQVWQAKVWDGSRLISDGTVTLLNE